MHKNILIIVLFLVSGCHNVYEIKVNSDGSAVVDHKMRFIYEDEILLRDSTLISEANIVGGPDESTLTVSESMTEFYRNSKVIKDFKWTANRNYYFDASYKITTIDSIGNYLDPFTDYVQPIFEYSEEKFSMICPPGEVMSPAEGDDDDLWDDKAFPAIFIEFNFQFENKIYGCSTNEENLKIEHSNKELNIKFNFTELFYKTENTEFEVYFKPQKLGCSH
ncbi:MAG: hypothetical protein GQ574_26255 [Crocinitomix sp.]|nr:hypothetical protein [Crocinitomix sp.]